MYSYMQSIPYHRDNSMVMVLKNFADTVYSVYQPDQRGLRKIHESDIYFLKAISPIFD